MSKPARNCFNYTQRRLCFSRTALVLWVRLPVGTRGQGRSGRETRPGQRPPLCPHSLSLSHSFGPCSDLRRQVQDGRGLHHHLVLLSTRGVSPGGFSLLSPPPPGLRDPASTEEASGPEGSRDEGREVGTVSLALSAPCSVEG